MKKQQQQQNQAQQQQQQQEAQEEVQEVPQQGYGRFEYINQTLYVGNWKLNNGVKTKHGHGKIVFAGGQNSEFGNEEYEGDWEDDKMHGFGVYKYTSGAKYEGQWNHGEMHGTGTMVYADGTSYSGSWEHNLMHGEGTYTDLDKVAWTGIFVEGSFESKIQKKLKAEKQLKDKLATYETKAKTFFVQFQEAFAKGDKKTWKDLLSPFFATEQTCIDYFMEPYTKYEEKTPDKWNELVKTLYDEGNVQIRVLTMKEESEILPPANILVEQLRGKIGGQLVEIEGSINDKTVQLALAELPSEQWVIVQCQEK